MIKSVTVTNFLKENLKIDLLGPEKSGLIISEIRGLGASDASINITDLASLNGGHYNSSRINSRNITLSVQYLGSESVEVNRQKLYKYFPIGKPLRLTFETEIRKCYVDGYVESNEADIFSKEASSTISIICPDPYMYSTDSTTTSLSGIDPLFEFPFHKDLNDKDTLVLSDIRIIKDRSVFYVGEADVGITISIHALGDIKDLVIYNTDTKEKIVINDKKLEDMTGYGIISKDDIIISTVRGQKSVTLVRSGVFTNIINAIDRDMSWFQLSKGDNIFTYSASEGEYNVQMSIRNRIAYEGI